MLLKVTKHYLEGNSSCLYCQSFTCTRNYSNYFWALIMFFFFFFYRQVLFNQNLGKRKRLVVRQEKLKCSKSKVVIFTNNFKHSYSDWKFRNSNFNRFYPADRNPRIFNKSEADSLTNIISTGQSNSFQNRSILSWHLGTNGS